ncbi:cobalamin biosynthesis protein [Methanobacterium sp.]|uniref:cobalamin biosynthesis protein n=1 Tax=Methanobacterium sp. TaxID=2164 RepID=UPI0025CB8DB7|nr:cobalamin biosynthesis protein [Methanobacterium sp.]MBI5460094.1 cobalamin biosynthesis protein [Methanobacterium sp.]
MEIELLIVIVVAILIDLIFGELPSSIHPVVWMGKSIEKSKNLLYGDSKNKNRLSGFLMTAIILIAFNILFLLILHLSSFLCICLLHTSSFNYILFYILFLLIASIILSTTFAIRSLLNLVYNVYLSINEDLEKGRRSVSFLVSRDTSNLSPDDVVSASIETLTENITDSVVSPLFYIFLFGSLGTILFYLNTLSYLNSFSISWGMDWIGSSGYHFPIILGVLAGVSYRVVNTLDAMVGYKDPQNIDIGWFPAKLDDILNYIPARITGFLVFLSAILMKLDYKCAWQVMLNDARNTPSPNSGYPMASAAGALGVQLVKPGVYKLGYPKNGLKPEMIKKAIKLTITTITIFLIIIILIPIFTFLLIQ